MTLDQAKKWFEISAKELNKQKDFLTELDAKIGDADHGTNIARGLNEIVLSFQEKKPTDIGALFKGSAVVMMSKAGGASGMLYTNFFLKASEVATGKVELTKEEFIEALDKGIHGIIDRGRASVGDKTMIDVWIPSLNLFKKLISEGMDLKTASCQVATQAKKEVEKTIPIIAKRGGASYLGERSIGHQDPGATSTCILLESLAKALN